MIRRIPNKTARRNPKARHRADSSRVLQDILSKTPVNKRGDYVLPEIAALYSRRIDPVTDMVQNHFKCVRNQIAQARHRQRRKTRRCRSRLSLLRHTFVSLCRESNAPLSVVESIVGHSNPAMTRHYTHVGELAAGRAVALLPAVIGDHKPERNGEENPLAKIRNIAKSMTAANWKKKKNELLALLVQNKNSFA